MCPPFATSSDGRYLACSETNEVIDTNDLRLLVLPKLASAIRTAIGLSNGNVVRPIALTQNLGFIIVPLSAVDEQGSRFFVANGTPYERAKYWAFVSTCDGKIGAFPDQCQPSGPNLPSERFIAAGESLNGELLLLYSDSDSEDGRTSFVLRDASLQTRFKISPPSYGLLSGPWPATSWDPSTNRLLVYYFNGQEEDRAPLKILIYDYSANTLKKCSLALTGLFHKDGSEFVSNTRTQ